MQSDIKHAHYLTKIQAKAFTLIELLVVIAIIAILAAILFPVFAQAKLAAKQAVFMSNMKQTTTGAILYLSDSEDTFMPRDRDDQKCPPYQEQDDDACGEMPGKWSGLLYPYTKSLGTLYSPVETDRNRTWVDPNHNPGYFTAPDVPERPSQVVRVEVRLGLGDAHRLQRRRGRLRRPGGREPPIPDVGRTARRRDSLRGQPGRL